MQKILTSWLVFTALQFGSAVAAEPQQCLASPSRIEPCNNLVYRAITDPKTQERRLFCFCKEDFDRLLKSDVTDREHAYNKMQWQQILAETGYTDEQLKALIKR